MMKKFFLSLVLLGTFAVSNAQLSVQALHENPVIKRYLNSHPNYEWNTSSKLHKWGTKDTLELPFFEEFLYDHIYPDSSKWLNNMVYVNRHFGVKPPSYGVATFDQLDENGNPYLALNNTDITTADTLTSQYLNMDQMDGHNLAIKDSVYLSFYYESKGLGQEITSGDELILSFKKSDDTWVEVWKATGTDMSDFKQVLIPLDSASYFYNGFQFRFHNVSHRWGNNNHWHVDYIELDTGRTYNDLFNRDVAIQSEPSSLLKNYSSMPYEHFMADVAGEMQNKTEIRLSNRFNLTKQVSLKYNDRIDATTIGSLNNFNNIDNVLLYDDTVRSANLYDFSGQTGKEITITRTLVCKEDSTESLPQFQNNDTIVSYQIFDNYYAMDDGSAEAGFGFDNLIGKDGSIAIEFNLKKKDTLQGVGFYFTQINHDVSQNRFTITVWKEIGANGGTENILYESFQAKPTYSNKINGYTFYELDQDVVLEPGKFYIGWSQDSDFSLNVGLDQNHGRILGRNNGANPNIFYKVGNTWIKNTNAALYGSPMIRAYVGEFKDPTASIEKPNKVAVSVYPNPVQNQINFRGLNVSKAEIYNIQGGLIKEFSVKNNQIDLSELRNGRYLLRWMDENSLNSGSNWIQVIH